MGDPCGVSVPVPSHRLWRNGMDFQPKKTYPPDYSNVPSVRDWQMSPFSNERFDLDELQRAQKRGFKGRFEYERLKKIYGNLLDSRDGGPGDEAKESTTTARDARPKVPVARRDRCTNDYIYQPYGPAVVSALSYSRPSLVKPRLYTYLGPSFYAGFQFKTPAPQTVSTVPCAEKDLLAPGRVLNLYMPYGPYGELRFTPDMYTPMGPSVLPLNLKI